MAKRLGMGPFRTAISLMEMLWPELDDVVATGVQMATSHPVDQVQRL